MSAWPGYGLALLSFVVSGAVGVKKPDPRIFGIALSESGLRPDEVVHVGDAPEDIEGAQAAGIVPVLISRGAPEGEAPAGVTMITCLSELVSCGVLG